MISDDSRDYGEIEARAMHDPEKGIPGLFPEVATALGAVHQCRRGVLKLSEQTMHILSSHSYKKFLKEDSIPLALS
jgi:hypothetical protein